MKKHKINWDDPKERKEYKHNYYLKNKERQDKLNKEYRLKNKEQLNEYYKIYTKNYSKLYLKRPMGRAHNLLSSYKCEDKKHNRGKGDLTAKWIVDNIFSKPCKYCGKTGWDVIGCNRLDNSKPHTKDNVEPCCKECNKKLPRKYV